jgi:hypothetical protein
LTKSLAISLFGKGEAMGKIIRLDNKENYTVTGILKDLPTDTRFNFQYLLPGLSTGGMAMMTVSGGIIPFAPMCC